MIGSAEQFERLRAGAGLSNPATAGFYRMADNRAYVRHREGNEAAIIGTSLHEISHLITASHLGPTPHWLTEGLAEYFEQMVSHGQTATIHPNTRHLDLLRRQALPSLAVFTSEDRGGRWQQNSHRNYAQAWSLIYFLMDGDEGRSALREVIDQQQQHFCRPFSPGDALARAYPGGLPQLQQDWQAWLGAGIPKPHRI